MEILSADSRKHNRNSLDKWKKDSSFLKDETASVLSKQLWSNFIWVSSASAWIITRKIITYNHDCILFDTGHHARRKQNSRAPEGRVHRPSILKEALHGPKQLECSTWPSFLTPGTPGRAGAPRESAYCRHQGDVCWT